MARQDFYVNGESKREYVALAWKAACKLLSESGAATLWIVGLDMNRLKPQSDITAAVGKENAKLLAKGGHLSISGKTAKYYTERTLPRMGENAIILLIHPTLTLLTKADQTPVCAALVVVPWFFKDVQAWVDAYKPRDILQSDLLLGDTRG